MNQCDRLRPNLAHYLVGGLRSRARSRLEAHLRACPACRAEVAALQRTGALLDAAPLQRPPEKTWRAIRAQLTHRARAASRHLRYAWGIAASALAIALALISLFWLRPIAVGPTTPVLSPAAEEEVDAALQQRLPTVWATPLSDEAAVGLRFASAEEGG